MAEIEILETIVGEVSVEMTNFFSPLVAEDKGTRHQLVNVFLVTDAFYEEVDLLPTVGAPERFKHPLEPTVRYTAL